MKNKGFTLIEVLVATAIAAVTLIGTFFLLQSSFRESQGVLAMRDFDEVFLNTRNCILIQDIPLLSSSTHSIRYTSTGCIMDTYVSDLSFTGITIEKFSQGIPNSQTTYYSYFRVTPGSGSGAYRIEHNLIHDAQKGVKYYDIFR